MITYMLDTETVNLCRFDKIGNPYAFSLPYQVCLASLTDKGHLIQANCFYVKEVLDEIVELLSVGYTIQYLPNSLKTILTKNTGLKYPVYKTKPVLNRLQSLFDAKNASVIAHNASYDLQRLNNLAQDRFKHLPYDFLSCNWHECLSNLPALPYNEWQAYAHSVPNSKRGYATLKADYIAPYFLGKTQQHDALQDVLNQIELYNLFLPLGDNKLYSCFDIMRKGHTAHNVPLFVGTFTLDAPREVDKIPQKTLASL